jgi:Domain of unknown function (DUF4340)
MNFRITTLLFGLLLTTLWVFGLMIAQKKSAVDQSPVVPTLASRDASVDSITIKHPESKEKDKTKKASEFTFVNTGDRWYYKEGTQQVRVEGVRIKDMIDAVKDARPDESADLTKSLSAYGLEPPQLTVVLHGKFKDEKKDWSFFVGKESPDGASYYVNSNERPEKAHLVPKRAIERLFVANPNNLRAKRLFDPTEAQVKSFEIIKGSKKLEIKRDGGAWIGVEPKHLGFLASDAPAPEDKMPKDDIHKLPEKKKEEPTTGVRALVGNIIKVTVENDDDFVPLGGNLADYELDKNPYMKIEISTSDDGKAVAKDTLLVGKQVPNKKDVYYYARLAADDGVFMLPAKTIAPIEKAVDDPEKLRSKDIAVFEPEKIDYFVLKQKDEEVKFALLDRQKNWEMFFIKEKKKEGDILEMKKTDDNAVESLVKHLLGKNAIVDFKDVADADMKKKLADFELEKPAVEITLYENAIEKKEEKKDDKDKKTEKKTEPDKNKLPDLKKDLKAKLKLEFGKVENDKVYVRRTLENGTTSVFEVKKEFLDKILPAGTIELSYLDTTLPPFLDVVSVSMRLDKGEPLELFQHGAGGKEVWYTKDKTDPSGLKLAESAASSGLVARFAHNAKAVKWVAKIDDKTDFDKYGLKNPVATVTFRVAQPAQDLMTAMGMLGSPDVSVVAALGPVAGRHQTLAGTEEVKFELGKDVPPEPKDKDKEKEKEKKEDPFAKFKEKDKDKEKPGVYARRSGTNMIFVLPNDTLKYLKDTDFRDRASTLTVQPRLVASQFGISAGNSISALLFASPYFTGQLQSLDPDKIKDVRLTVRTRFESRSFSFERAGKEKDKTWVDKLNLPDFHVDQDKVNQFVKDFAKLHAERFVAIAGGPRDEHKLGPKEMTAKIELDLVADDGKKTTVTIVIGSRYLTHGYYAHTSYWPEVVFMLPLATVDPLLNGAEHFAKERSGAN